MRDLPHLSQSLGRLRAFAIDARRADSYAATVVTGYAALAVTALAQIVSVPILLQALGGAGFGLAVMLQQAVGLTTASILWMTGGGIRLLGMARARGRWRAFAEGHATLQTLSLVAAGAAAALGAAGTAAAQAGGLLGDQPNPAGLIAAVACVMFLLFEQQPQVIAFTGLARIVWVNAITTLNQIVAFAVLVALLRADVGLASVFWGQAAGLLAARLAAIVLWRRAPAPARAALRRPLGFRPWAVRRLLGANAPAYVVYGALTLASMADVLIIGAVGGPEAAALFAILWRVPSLAFQLLFRLPAFLEPAIVADDARKDYASQQARFRTGFRRYALTCAAAGLVSAVLAALFVPVWVGAFAAPFGWTDYAIAGAAVVAAGLARWPIQFAFTAARIWPLNALLIAELAVRLGLIVALFGETGPATPLWALVIAQAAGFGFAYFQVGSAAAQGRGLETRILR